MGVARPSRTPTSAIFRIFPKNSSFRPGYRSRCAGKRICRRLYRQRYLSYHGRIFQTDKSVRGAFITKLDPTGSSLVYSTYLNGGSFSTSSATSVAVDAAGNAHVTGFTTASDFPVVNELKSASNFFKTTDRASNWNNNNSGLLGDVRVIAVAPNGLSIDYAATVLGPYRSNDGGATWTKLPTTGLPSLLFPKVMAVSPVNSAVVYLGSNIGGGSGLFRSLDGGNTWTTVSLPISGEIIPSTLVFDPVTPSTVYVGTFKGLFRSTDSGNTWTPLNNFSGLALEPDVRTIAIDPTTPSTMYAGIFSAGFAFDAVSLLRHPGPFFNLLGAAHWCGRSRHFHV